MFRAFLLILATFILVGCATNEGGYKNASLVEQKLMQLSDVEVVSNLGAPTETLDLDGSTKVWTYRSEDDFINGGKCTISVTIQEKRVIAATVNSQDRSWVSFPLGACSPVIGNLD